MITENLHQEMSTNQQKQDDPYAGFNDYDHAYDLEVFNFLFKRFKEFICRWKFCSSSYSIELWTSTGRHIFKILSLKLVTATASRLGTSIMAPGTAMTPRLPTSASHAKMGVKRLANDEITG
jgi:hypothetical protein